MGAVGPQALGSMTLWSRSMLFTSDYLYTEMPFPGLGTNPQLLQRSESLGSAQ